MTDIRLTRSETERQAVYAFRYRVIVHELGVRPPTADYERGVIADREDSSGHVFAAYCCGRVVGTVRLNVLADGPAEPHSSLLGLERVEGALKNRVSVTSRLLVATDRRGGPLAVRLAQACYRHALTLGVERDYILVKPDLSPLYRRLGYRSIGADLEHPEVGRACPLRLDLQDSVHLQSVGSVFVRHIRRT